MKLSGLIKLVKSRSGILSALVAVLCGLLLGLIACHLYNLKKVEGFAAPQEQSETTYTFDIKLNDDKDNNNDLANTMSNDINSIHSVHNVPNHLAHHALKQSDPVQKTKAKAKAKAKAKSDKDQLKHAAKAAIATFSDKLNSGSVSGSESPGTNVQMNANSLNDFYNQLPRGISRNNIPEGDEDLYILKSEIVPPVCPACPTFNCPREKPCPPCPSCERCPEPAFECKKVPNYNVSNVDEYLPSASNYFSMSNVDNKQPRPVLNDFSEFN
jgi:hypothetical protein